MTQVFLLNQVVQSDFVQLHRTLDYKKTYSIGDQK